MLTEEQQKIIMESMWVINSALKKQDLGNNEDLRQDAVLYMCKCIQRFDASKNVKWTTYAYRNIYFYIKERVKNLRKKGLESCNKVDIVEFTEVVDEDWELKEANRERIKMLKEKCTSDEKMVMSLIMQGYKINELPKMLGKSRENIRQIELSIREKGDCGD